MDFKIPVISLEWIDERFQWNPGQYAAVESIRVQGKDIWFPSIKDLLIFRIESHESCDAILMMNNLFQFKSEKVHVFSNELPDELF